MRSPPCRLNGQELTVANKEGERLFQRVRELAAALAEAGHQQSAFVLRSDLLLSASSGLEIAMALRHHLKEISRAENVAAEMRKSAAELWHAFDRAIDRE
jgi:hypothetical protein